MSFQPDSLGWSVPKLTDLLSCSSQSALGPPGERAHGSQVSPVCLLTMSMSIASLKILIVASLKSLSAKSDTQIISSSVSIDYISPFLCALTYSCLIFDICQKSCVTGRAVCSSNVCDTSTAPQPCAAAATISFSHHQARTLRPSCGRLPQPLAATGPPPVSVGLPVLEAQKRLRSIHTARSQGSVCFVARYKKPPQTLQHFNQAPPPALVILTYVLLRPWQEILACLMGEQVTLTRDLL